VSVSVVADLSVLPIWGERWLGFPRESGPTLGTSMVYETYKKLLLNSKVKLLKKAIMYLTVKLALAQDTKAQRGSRCIALLFL
jgi:hypothetical protein